MKTKSSIFFVILIFLNIFPHKANAALSPYYQSLKEIRELLLLPELEKKVGSNFKIEHIRRTSYGYEISSGGCVLPIEMKYLPSTVIGPQKFAFTIRYLVCSQ